ncbi:polysaccharide deacetylase family protein [Poritiphilus flavus]|uniref:ChbG/HpnK family deacetylase n=1 Tax=Poritiphilus flavus TaxID=2697053 RepID=A0A6L9EEM0_9FLAO|nr:polysaccharide deacetylase family protein [Poritiphilus flavus]NAS13214.1 ChbG/HpnK family deacetylase [Poritiphilus flavus]
MKKLLIPFCTLLLCQNFLFGQQVDIYERLGYPKDSKLLIIHADDLGVTHSENMASIEGLEKTPVNSASIMVPCPWFPEIADYARKNSSRDLGVHLTLNSEWNYYKWGPVSSVDAVPSLVNKDGYFYASVDSLLSVGKAEEVEIELRNQVKKAYQSGIDLTHLDAHMGAAASRPDYLAAYMKIGKEFQLPVLLDGRIYQIQDQGVKDLLDERTVVMDNILGAAPSDFDQGMAAYYKSVLNNLSPGLNCLLIHLAYDDEETRAVTVDHPYWGAEWRQADVDFFSSQECKELLEEQNIILVTWRELRDKITRAP